jgi:hypothetical protein
VPSGKQWLAGHSDVTRPLLNKSYAAFALSHLSTGQMNCFNAISLFDPHEEFP